MNQYNAAPSRALDYLQKGLYSKTLSLCGNYQQLTPPHY